METIKNAVKDIEADLIAFTRELVRTRSYTGEEEKIIRLLQEKMTALGYEDIRVDDMGNLVGRIGHGGTASRSPVPQAAGRRPTDPPAHAQPAGAHPEGPGKAVDGLDQGRPPGRPTRAVEGAQASVGGGEGREVAWLGRCVAWPCCVSLPCEGEGM